MFGQNDTLFSPYNGLFVIVSPVTESLIKKKSKILLVIDLHM